MVCRVAILTVHVYASVARLTCPVWLPPLRSESLHELERFNLRVNGPVNVLASSGWQSELNSVVSVGQVSNKLTAHMKDQWSDIVQSSLPKTPNLRQFVDWVRDLIVRRRLAPPKFEQMTDGGLTTIKRNASMPCVRS
uniref:Uncharacterized protein n=1 Tax=Trichuris muris TaxID=70415 RepID=A0A5S6QK03_TRIMR